MRYFEIEMDTKNKTKQKKKVLLHIANRADLTFEWYITGDLFNVVSRCALF